MHGPVCKWSWLYGASFSFLFGSLWSLWLDVIFLLAVIFLPLLSFQRLLILRQLLIFLQLGLFVAILLLGGGRRRLALELPQLLIGEACLTEAACHG